MRSDMQALSYFKWINFELSRAPAGRRPLIINMDETSLAYHIAGLKGTVVKGARGRDQASLSELRGHVSYLAAITDDAEIQPLLPQVLIGNAHKFTLQTLRAVAPKLPQQVHLWREKTAWNTYVCMRRYIALLSKALGSILQARFVILLLDCAKVHFHPSISRLAAQKGLRLVYVPAKMTSFLQPCDTHLFSIFKHTLQESWRRRKSEVLGGVVSTQDWISVICNTVEKVVVGQSWQRAFLQDGVLLQQQFLSEEACASLGWKGPPLAGNGPPTADDVVCVMPRRARTGFLMSSLKDSGPSAPKKRRRLPATFVRTLNGRPIETLD
jgi:hypothetical protein